MLSLCITNYNRYDILLESFEKVINDPRISEIIISDDHSDIQIYRKLFERFEGHEKVKVYRNAINLGMSRNKRRSVELASNAWAIVFDSDNIIYTSYLDAFFNCFSPEKNEVIYCPDAALPEFDYTKYSGEVITYENAGRILATGEPMFNCLMNTANYIVNKERYLDVYQYDPLIKGSDTIFFNYLWLKSGGLFYVVPGMSYFHRVHKGSGFLKHANYNLRKAEETRKLIMEL